MNKKFTITINILLAAVLFMDVTNILYNFVINNGIIWNQYSVNELKNVFLYYILICYLMKEVGHILSDNEIVIYAVRSKNNIIESLFNSFSDATLYLSKTQDRCKVKHREIVEYKIDKNWRKNYRIINGKIKKTQEKVLFKTK